MIETPVGRVRARSVSEKRATFGRFWRARRPIPSTGARQPAAWCRHARSPNRSRGSPCARAPPLQPAPARAKLGAARLDRAHSMSIHQARKQARTHNGQSTSLRPAHSSGYALRNRRPARIACKRLVDQSVIYRPLPIHKSLPTKIGPHRARSTNNLTHNDRRSSSQPVSKTGIINWSVGSKRLAGAPARINSGAPRIKPAESNLAPDPDAAAADKMR